MPKLQKMKSHMLLYMFIRRVNFDIVELVQRRNLNSSQSAKMHAYIDTRLESEIPIVYRIKTLPDEVLSFVPTMEWDIIWHALPAESRLYQKQLTGHRPLG
jgi:hypothetical protein